MVETHYGPIKHSTPWIFLHLWILLECTSYIYIYNNSIRTLDTFCYNTQLIRSTMVLTHALRVRVESRRREEGTK